MYHTDSMILIITAHPSPDSFTATLAETISGRLEESDMEVHIADLYRLPGIGVFPPVLDADELKRKTSLDPVVQQQMQLVEEASGYIIIHPEWWGGPPAVLKGWLDRVLRPGTAYETPEGREHRSPEGLLNDKKALIIVSGDEPEAKSLEILWLEKVWRFCGVEAEMHYLPETWDSRLADREGFREKVIDAAQRLFGS